METAETIFFIFMDFISFSSLLNIFYYQILRKIYSDFFSPETSGSFIHWKHNYVRSDIMCYIVSSARYVFITIIQEKVKILTPMKNLTVD